MHDQVTVVVGIDAKTIEYLKVSVETWRLHRPEMWGMPWVLFWDWTQISREQLCMLASQLNVPNLRTVQWPGGGCPPKSEYESQRELMLSGHVWVPGAYVQTPWHMKIDADVIALGPSDWLQKAWFEDTCDTQGGTLECDADCEPRYIAPFWGYTKGLNYLGRLEAWGDEVNWGPHGDHSRLNIPFDPTHLRVPHKRMCSWVSYYNVAWERWLCSQLERTVGVGRLPVPSQDTTVWYAAERENKGLRNYRIVSQKALNWTNCSKLSSLKETAARVLGTSMVDA